MKNTRTQKLFWMWMTVFILVGVMASAGLAVADDWQWPARMSLAGFAITRIQGQVDADGYGSAKGVLQTHSLLPNPNVVLQRSQAGDITGSGSVSGRISGIEFQAEFVINSASISGGGKGRIASLSFPVALSASGDVLVFRGTLPMQSQVDTPLATYKFDGALNLGCGANRANVFANGLVKRVGKLSEQVTEYPISEASVSLQDGTSIVKLGGVAVKFKFF